ncbi:GLPGLI family protein [Aquimarina aggregata]|uniref:GLPGLI family protein n=1 Tax=Aquimarina aggregata TaxID=1642818 RepID=UPI002493B442|nr:GLPGLI family protein [Aquimarina aggregata]
MKNLLCLLTLLVTTTIIAQDQHTGIIEYQNIVNNKNGVSFANPYKLYFDDTTSFYEKIGDAKKIIGGKEEERVGLNGEMISDKIVKSNLPKPYYYADTKTNELIFRESIAQKLYFIRDTIQKIPWQLHEERKKIGEYTCQKATAKFRGREYTVWFTSEIPISHGPWKLRGLPGLIVEASEETGKYEFRGTTINLNPNINEVKDKLKKPDISKIKDLNTYITALKNKYDETMAKARASLPRGARIMTDCDVCPDPKNYSLERFE